MAAASQNKKKNMYEEYFSLSCRPFELSPDPRFLFMTAQHSRAVANIKFALMNRDSFVIITGEIGIGKTTVVNTVLNELGPEYVTAKLTHTTLSDIELLQALLSAFGMPTYSKKKVLLLDTLRQFFLKTNKAGKHVVIIVDEAQNLSGPALEELRLISCIDNDDRNLVSIALTGQRGLDDLVDSPNLVQLRQRARLRQRLESLTEEETFDYVQHRLDIAGADVNEIFDREAISEVYRLSFGIPRLINTLCDTALMSCMVEEESRVTLKTIDSVIQELRWQWFADRDQEQPSQRPDHESVPTANQVTLTISRSGKIADKILVEHLPFTIGRRSANDLVLLDKDVSQRHAMINCEAGIYVLEDLNSTNGLVLNGEQRSLAVLRDGDWIGIGKVDIMFNAGADEETDPRKSSIADPGKGENVFQMDAVADDSTTVPRLTIREKG